MDGGVCEARRGEGYELWKPDGMTQSGRSGAFTAMTQDQGTKLEGLMTSLQMHGASIDEKLDNVSEDWLGHWTL